MQTIATLLVVQDPGARRQMRAVLEKHTQLRVDTCDDFGEALDILTEQSIGLLYCDVRLNNASGIDLAREAKIKCPGIRILIGSTHGSAQDVLDALQAGADEFIVDPANPELIDAAIGNAILKVQACESAASCERSTVKSVITQDRTLLGVLDIAGKVAPSPATILITGESGTGKELLAEYIHAHSQRRNAPYLAINCAALPDQLAESELFGHEKGAFTGAITRKIGKFEDAGKGTLVLDEITEMALPLQAKLLRALQERQIVRLGGNRSITVDARVIAISNRKMKQAIAGGHFREDLYYRLNVIPLTIPPLRERKNDIPLLSDYFLKRFSVQNHSAMARISEGAMTVLMSQSWPGNVRELENTIQRGVLIGSGDTLLAEHLILDEPSSPCSPGPSPTAGITVRDMEKQLIYNTLEAVNDNRTHAAKMLGISIRTLRNKLNEYREEQRVAG